MFGSCSCVWTLSASRHKEKRAGVHAFQDDEWIRLGSFAQLLERSLAFEGLPAHETAHIPKTKEGKLPSPWRLYRCALAAKNFSTNELIGAMDLLLQANLQLVSTQLDERLVLEQALVRIAGNQPTKTGVPR